jgi:hypothetical protein
MRERATDRIARPGFVSDSVDMQRLPSGQVVGLVDLDGRPWREVLAEVEASALAHREAADALRHVAAAVANDAVREGVTWSEVAHVLGISRQGAMKRYGARTGHERGQ